jgi:hypothetical protein
MQKKDDKKSVVADIQREKSRSRTRFRSRSESKVPYYPAGYRIIYFLTHVKFLIQNRTSFVALISLFTAT